VSKSDTIPTRFDPEETRILRLIQDRTGLNRSEIVRRSVRLLRREVEKHGGSIAFLFEDLAPAVAPEETHAPRPTGLISETPGPRARKKKI
jgi:hypothetical protein